MARVTDWDHVGAGALVVLIVVIIAVVAVVEVRERAGGRRG